MDNLFGIPMASIMDILLVAFALCLGVGFWIFLRHRVVFKMGVRNVPRRPAQTTLIVIGLMLSTLIIAAAFGTGDTLDHSIKSQVYEVYGQVDEQITLGGTDTAAGLQTGAHMPESSAVTAAGMSTIVQWRIGAPFRIASVSYMITT